MGNMLTYRGYTASVSYDADGAYLYGAVSGIRDKVYFEKGKAPEKPFKGAFNVRVGSALHERAALKAAEKGELLNQFVAEAIAASV